MALNRLQLKNDLKSLLSDMKKLDNSEQGIEIYADRLSTIINDYIKSAQVNSGISVSVTGTAAAQTGATTSPGTLS